MTPHPAATGMRGDLTESAVRRPQVASRRPRHPRPGGESAAAWGMLAPTLLLLGLLAVYPLLYALYLSMTTAQVGAPGRFVGLENFLRLPHTAIFALTLWNTVLYTVSAVAVKLALGLVLAFVLAQRAPGMKWIRGAVLVPWVAPISLSVLAWTWMFDSTFSVFNWALMHLHLISGPIGWLGTPRLARFAVVLVNVWSGLPFFGITFLAGLVTIPQELYEAATVDGVGALGRVRRITLPLLRPVIATVVLFSVVMTSSDFATIFVLTHGGPMNTTQVLSTLAFRLGLATGDLGNGAAISLYLFPALLLATTVQARLMRRTWQW
ncbi:MAG: sugar ABC transporter permease [Bacillati bacterium ANGP1]|uniref:Sugar ABC transporter permease n=1 Tax=Candidatus Segetimicrobium genomatis TaxID=2569760 RepID=A0A537JUM4_9BACT|nr:MAG: sugar ABC transporter permease [Terrabacteria group bacterium ANGP1]